VAPACSSYLSELLQNRRSCVGHFENLYGDLFEQPTLSQGVQLGLTPLILCPMSYLARKFQFLLDDRLTRAISIIAAGKAP